MTKDEALAWIAGMFDEPVSAITPDRPRDGIFGWDSLGVLTLMAELDEKFNIHLDEKQMNSLAKVGDILTVLRNHGSLQD